MAENVISFEERRTRLKASGPVSVVLRVTEEGKLEIEKQNGGGRILETYEASAEQTRVILHQLAQSYSQFLRRTMGPPTPIAKTHPKPDPRTRRRCGVYPGQGDVSRKCARLKNHEGGHRDRSGAYFTHVCGCDTIIYELKGPVLGGPAPRPAGKDGRMVCHCGREMG